VVVPVVLSIERYFGWQLLRTINQTGTARKTAREEKASSREDVPTPKISHTNVLCTCTLFGPTSAAISSVTSTDTGELYDTP